MDISGKDETLTGTKQSRRKFLTLAGKVMAFLAAMPLLNITGRKAIASGVQASGLEPAISVKNGNYTLLKNGFIVDGTGKKGFQGNLLIDGDKIEKISEQEINAEGKVVDCTGLTVMPGIIDAHSHMDWYLPIKGHDELKLPFTAQGITTFMAGQCGFAIAGYRENSPYMGKIGNSLFPMDLIHIQWDTMQEYFDYLKKNGMTHNMMSLVGQGTTRTSIRGFDASPITKDEMKEMLGLLEDAMDQGASGVSFGLQYEPGIFTQGDELRQIARLVKKKDKLMTVHLRAYSALAPGYPMSTPKILLDYVMPFDGYEPHNLMAIDELLDVARETGVRLQISHLIFVGVRTFKTCDEALSRIDKAIKEGVDVKFDTYSYHCGQSILGSIFPAWFLAQAPAAYSDKNMLKKLKSEFGLAQRFLGFGVNDIQITYANNPELNEFNGMFLSEIAKKRGMDWFDATMDIARKTNVSAAVLNHRYSDLSVVENLMRHPASLFMTDALPEEHGVQNPAAYGNFPRFFQLAREKKIISLEEAVFKMTGATAQRYKVKDRGFLKDGLAADITVIDFKNIKDNNTVTETSNKPTGVEAVFINGIQVADKGKADGSIMVGKVLV